MPLLLALLQYDPTTQTPQISGGLMGGMMLVAFAIFLFFTACLWRIFTKAGQPGWAAIIPIYNTYIMLKIAGRPGWWLILLLIPFINIIPAILLLIDISKSFGHGVGFALGLLFLAPIFFPILAFGSSQYQGPAVRTP